MISYSREAESTNNCGITPSARARSMVVEPIQSVHYPLLSGDEGRKQLYWGAFWLGGAAFCEHKKSGFWLDSMAVEELALRRYRSLLESGGHDDLNLVDDADIGQSFFTEGTHRRLPPQPPALRIGWARSLPRIGLRRQRARLISEPFQARPKKNPLRARRGFC